MSPLLGSIPSPSSGNLGPFHMYGVILAVGVLVAVVRGRAPLAPPRVPARRHLRHLVLGRHLGRDRRAPLPRGHRLRAVRARPVATRSRSGRAGLGIWGAVIGGAIAVVVITRRRHMPTLAVMDCMAPGIVLAQAIGRWGNWFNQELFGKPTTLPWALEIAAAHRPIGLPAVLHDVPADVPLRVAVRASRSSASCCSSSSRFPLKLGQTFALYVVLYTFAPVLVREPAHRSRARDRPACG